MCASVNVQMSGTRVRSDRDVGPLPQMQTATRGLTIKQYQPAIQPISVTSGATLQPIATVVTGSNVKDDYESAWSNFVFRQTPSSPPFFCYRMSLTF